MCWEAASTSSGGSSRPDRAALPESSCHRVTRACLAAVSLRSSAAFGSIIMTMRVHMARSRLRVIACCDELRDEFVGGERGEPEGGGLLPVRFQPPGGEFGDGRLLHPRR